MLLERSHYQTLNVTRDAPEFLIRAAYKSLSQKYHPDVNPEDPNANATMAAINYAYQTLSDSDERKGYDRWLDKQAEKKVTRPDVETRTHRENDPEKKRNARTRTTLGTLIGSFLSFGFLAVISLFILTDPQTTQLRSLVKEMVNSELKKLEND